MPADDPKRKSPAVKLDEDSQSAFARRRKSTSHRLQFPYLTPERFIIFFKLCLFRLGRVCAAQFVQCLTYGQLLCLAH